MYYNGIVHLLVIFIAKYFIVIVGLIAAGYWLTLPNKQKLHMVIFATITGLIAYGMAKLGGMLFYDPRPFVSDHVVPFFSYTADNGFPSDHTLVTAVIAVSVYMASKKLGIGLLVLSILIGVSRVLAHVHHPLDIVGSLIFAGVGAGVAYYVTPMLLSRILKSMAMSENRET